MSADIIKFPGPTAGPVDPEAVLTGALEAGLSEVVVIGVTADGTAYYATSDGDAMRSLWMTEQFKRRLMAMFDAIEGG